MYKMQCNISKYKYPPEKKLLSYFPSQALDQFVPLSAGKLNKGSEKPSETHEMSGEEVQT